MKKYRSLWCMSTTNHNILYFAVIPGTSLLNTAICLWKAQNSLAWRGDHADFASRPVQIRPVCHALPNLKRSGLIPKPSPRGDSPQDAKQVQFARAAVGVVDNSAHSLDELRERRGSWVPGCWRRSLPIRTGLATEATRASRARSVLTCQLAIARGARLTRCTRFPGPSSPAMG